MSGGERAGPTAPGPAGPSGECGLLILVWTLISVIAVSCVTGACGSDFTCSKLKTFLESKKFLDSELPWESLDDGHLRTCTKDSRTCCLPETEKFLATEGRKAYNKAVTSAISQLSSVLGNRSKRFDSFFKTLLSESKRDFDKMFKKTYGVIYEQNSYVFTDLFEKLEAYYSNGQVDLEKAMENFFNTLYQKMFTVLNAQYQFNDKYLICIGRHMEELKPFGDVPQKLSVQIKRSFVATRTFAQALNLAKDVVDNMQSLGGAGDCNQAHTRMSYCQACKNAPEIKPCSSYCLNVLKGCLAYHLELDSEWNNFVDAMDKVSDRLLGPFNIEVVVEPINIKISEAIMNFQENANEVSEKVFSGCGRLHLGRRSRRESRELELETYQFGKEEAKQHPSQSQPSLEKLIRDIRQRIKDSRSFWSGLPHQICADAATAKDSACWNGTVVGRYTRKIVGNGLGSQQTNPEVSVDTVRSRNVLNEQVYSLKVVTGKLKNAYNGFDVEWIDVEDSPPIEMGSGEGSGHDQMEPEGSGGGAHVSRDYDDTEGGDDDDGDHRVFAPKKPPTTNDESNVIPKDSDDFPAAGSGDKIYPTNSSSGIRSQIALAKAVASYLFPICVVWLGGLLSDWL